MKLYTALRFKERPDLHMTLTYFGEVSEDVQAAIVDRTDEKVRITMARAFPTTLDREAHFGAKHDIRVLMPGQGVPEWVKAFVRRQWAPHITCTDARLDLTATAVALMSKQTEIKRWELP